MGYEPFRIASNATYAPRPKVYSPLALTTDPNCKTVGPASVASAETKTSPLAYDIMRPITLTTTWERITNQNATRLASIQPA